MKLKSNSRNKILNMNKNIKNSKIPILQPNRRLKKLKPKTTTTPPNIIRPQPNACKTTSPQYSLNIAELSKRLLDGNKQLELIKYIYRVQGAAWGHLNYRKTAQALNVDKNTVARYVRELAKINILELDGKQNLKISESLVH